MAGMAKTIHEASKQGNPARAARDVAVLCLFATRGLRRDEVVSLDLKHVESKPGGRSRLLVQRKKRLEREWVSIPDDTAETLAAWIAIRGTAPGPLFTSFAVRNRRPDQRLAESSVWAIVRQHARAAGLETRPHGFRHAAVTAVLDETGGNVRGAQLFAGHGNPATTMKYDDNRQDIAGEMSDLVADALKKALEKVRRDEKP
jgi:integrase/recombinase XerC